MDNKHKVEILKAYLKGKISKKELKYLLGKPTIDIPIDWICNNKEKQKKQDYYRGL